MTKNELFTAISNATPDVLAAVFGDNAADAQELATHALELDAAAKSRAKEKRANGTAAESATHKANVELFNSQMLGLLTNEPQTAAVLAEAMGIKTSKATAVAKVGVELGLCAVTDVKIPGKAACKGYALAE